MTRIPSILASIIISFFLSSCQGGPNNNAVNAENNGSPPTAPTGVTAVVQNDRVLINWNQVDAATSYTIYWSTNPGVTKKSGRQITGVRSPYTHTPPSSGATYYYVVTASNDHGEGSESSQSFALLNKPPLAALAGPTSALKNVLVSFDASGSTDPDGAIVSFKMDFGDGYRTTQTTSLFSHTYTSHGNFVASLTITDNLGATQFTTCHVTVGISVTTPVNVSNTSTYSQDQSFTIEPNGYIHVFWIDNGSIYYSRSSDKGATFGPPRELFSSFGGYSYGYPTSTASTNAVNMSWTVYDNVYGGAEIFYIQSSDGGNNFTSSLMVSADDGINSYASSIASDGGSRIAIAWNNLGRIAFAISKDGGKTFSSSKSFPGGSGLAPSMALTASGTYASWMEGPEGAQEIYFAVSTDGGNQFGTPLNISQYPEKSWSPLQALDAVGTIYIVWIEGAAFQNRKILFATSVDGGQSFSAPITLSNSAIDSFCPSLAADEAGKFYITWSSSSDYYATMQSYIIFSGDGGKTFSPALILPYPSAASGCPKIIANGANQIGMLWNDTYGANSQFPDIFFTTVKVSIH